MAGVADTGRNQHMDAAFLRLERLVEAQRLQLEELRNNHEALTDALCAVRASKPPPAPPHAVGALDAGYVQQVRQGPVVRLENPNESEDVSSPSAAVGHPARHAGTAALRTASTPVSSKSKIPNAASSPNGESGAMKVVAAAHQRGLTLDDMGSLGEKEWQDLGATPEERQTILGALEARRQRLVGGRGNPQGGSPGSDAPKELDQEERFQQVSPPKSILGGPDRARQGGIGGYDGPLFQAPRNVVQSEQPIADVRSPGSNGPIAGARSPAKEGFEIGLGRGRQYIAAVDHIRGGTCIDGWGLPPSEQGRRHFGADKDHVYGGAADDNVPGAHGHIKDSALQGGLARGIGHGKHHIPVQDHIHGGTAVLDNAGTHGHSRDDDYEEGLQRGIGRGRRHLNSGMDAVIGAVHAAPTPAATPAGGGFGQVAKEGPCSIAAGMPSRYRTMSDPAVGFHRQHY